MTSRDQKKTPASDEGAPFTASGLEAAKPRLERYEIRDGACPGLCLRVERSGAKAFRWYVTSAKRVITLGRFSMKPRPGHLTLGEARVWIEKLKAGHQAGHGQLGAVEAELQALGPQRKKLAADGGPVTVAAVAADFMVYIARERKRPEQAQRPIDCDIIPVLGDRPITSITSQDCRHVIEAVVRRGSTRQAGVVLAVLKQFLGFALDRALIEVNPAERFRNPKALGITANVSQRFLSADEITAFWRALDAYQGLTPTVRGGLKLLLLTGVRSGELLKARLTDIDFTAKTWTIPVEHQKLTRERERTARPFVVPLAPTALGLFEELIALAKSLRSSHVMASLHAKADAAPLTDKALNHAMRRLFEGEAPLLKFEGERPTPHDLRRTVRTHLGERLGVQWHIAERCLNHALGKVASTYDVGDYLNERRAALEQWGEYVARLVDPALSNVVTIKKVKRA